jgi:hypothetical protein
MLFAAYTNLTNNYRYKRISEYVELLNIKRQRVLKDIEVLNQSKQAALANPLEFLEQLLYKASTLYNIVNCYFVAICSTSHSTIHSKSAVCRLR